MTRPDLLAPAVALGLTLALGCQDGPYSRLEGDPCLPGNVRRDGGPCVVAAGNHDDQAMTYSLAGVPPVALLADCGGCDERLPAELRVATLEPGAGPGWLVVDVALAPGAGAPTEAEVRYVVEVGPGPGQRNRATDAFVISAPAPGAPHELAYRKGGRQLVGRWSTWPALEVDERGFSVVVPRQALLQPSTFTLTVHTDRRVEGRWEPAARPAPLVVCWPDQVREADPCRG